jgi:hypothetical protein
MLIVAVWEMKICWIAFFCLYLQPPNFISMSSDLKLLSLTAYNRDTLALLTRPEQGFSFILFLHLSSFFY